MILTIETEQLELAYAAEDLASSLEQTLAPHIYKDGSILLSRNLYDSLKEFLASHGLISNLCVGLSRTVLITALRKVNLLVQVNSPSFF